MKTKAEPIFLGLLVSIFALVPAEAAEPNPAATAANAVAANQVASGLHELNSSVRVVSGADWLSSAYAKRGGSLADLLERAAAETNAAAAAEAVQQAARDSGYYLAKVEEDGNGGFKADPGTFGAVSVAFGTNAVPEGRWWSASQISNKLVRAGVREGAPFDYVRLYRAFYDLNANPDLTANVKLTKDRDDKTRSLGVHMDIKESMPLHAILGIDNYGTESSGDWMGRATLQYLNLWKADHALTVNGLSALDGSLYGAAGSYFVPFHAGRRDASFTVHGGYTKVDTDDVVPNIDVEGDGRFVGAQASVELLPSLADSLRLAVGLTYREVSDNLVIHDNGTESPLNENKVDVLPLSIALLYTERDLDGWMGRNYATVELVRNVGGSSDGEFHRQRQAADKDYWLAHMQLARIQTVGGSFDEEKDEWSGRSMVFAKVDAQIANGALVSAEQMGVGGANSVRGYKEREFLGDNAVTGTLEYRTPLLLGGIGSLMGRKTSDRLQFVAFLDGGWIGIEDALAGEDDSRFIASVGLGARAAWGENALLRLDWGLPLKDTDESETSDGGRIHVSVQAQF